MKVSGFSVLVGSGWTRRFALVLVVASCGSLSAAAASDGSTAASPGPRLHVLVTGNCFTEAVTPLARDLQELNAYPWGATVSTFDTSTGTPTTATLAAQDLVVSLGGDCSPYAAPATWGDRLADYVDGGGAVLQAADDNWDAPDAHPTGRFASGGYAPLDLGPKDDIATTLGQVLQPNNPIVKGLGTFANSDNTTTALAPSATLLATWADGRNAIAVKGRVVATSGADKPSKGLWSALTLLANNTLHVLGPHLVVVTTSGSGSGTVTSSPTGISCSPSCATRLASGDSLTLTATAAPDSSFLGWEGACSGIGTCTVTGSDSDVRVTATFGETLVSVVTFGSGTGTVTSSPAGISCSTFCATRLASGASLTLTATPAPGSSFLGWEGACTGTGTCTLTGSGSDVTAFARFRAMLPSTHITKASISSKEHTAAFEFEAAGAGTAFGFQCELRRVKHSKPRFKDCRSPKMYKHLKPGNYTFEVRTLGSGGSDPTPAKKNFKIAR